MPTFTTRTLKAAAGSAALLLFAASSVSAQVRAILPQGSVIIVRTQTALESNRLTQGQTFETVVDDTVGVDNYTVIPAGSRIRGVVTLVQAANRQQSALSKSTSIDSRLPTERRTRFRENSPALMPPSGDRSTRARISVSCLSVDVVELEPQSPAPARRIVRHPASSAHSERCFQKERT